MDIPILNGVMKVEVEGEIAGPGWLQMVAEDKDFNVCHSPSRRWPDRYRQYLPPLVRSIIVGDTGGSGGGLGMG